MAQAQAVAVSDALLGALIGGGIALIAQIIVAVVNVRAAHNRWLREQRTAAYTALLTSLNLHQQGGSKITTAPTTDSVPTLATRSGRTFSACTTTR